MNTPRAIQGLMFLVCLSFASFGPPAEAAGPYPTNMCAGTRTPGQGQDKDQGADKGASQGQGQNAQGQTRPGQQPGQDDKDKAGQGQGARTGGGRS